MVVALVALFVALTGTAIAGSGLITGGQIKDHSIGYVDLSSGATAKLHGQVGPAGAQGAQGPAGEAGGFDPAKVTYVTGAKTDLAPNSSGVTNLVALCPSGAKAVAGGGFIGVAAAGYSGPIANGTGWVMVANNSTPVDVPAAYAVAVCAVP
jgi:hypothetical protein